MEYNLKIESNNNVCKWDKYTFGTYLDKSIGYIVLNDYWFGNTKGLSMFFDNEGMDRCVYKI